MVMDIHHPCRLGDLDLAAPHPRRQLGQRGAPHGEVKVVELLFQSRNILRHRLSPFLSLSRPLACFAGYVVGIALARSTASWTARSCSGGKSCFFPPRMIFARSAKSSS